ncbi:WD40 repeat domain-containing protein [Cyclobacteriaceae bacterium]|nr:WD40 repeat domain-containing protein [Cyclobacteriaceae bacterium]
MKVSVNKLKTLQGHNDSVYALTQDHSTIYSSGGDGMVVAWEPHLNDDGKLLAKVPNSVYSLFVDDSSLLIGHNYSGIHLVDLTQGKEVKNVHLGNHAIFSIAKFQEQYLVGLANGELVVLQQDLSIVKSIKVTNERIRSILVDGDTIFLGCSDNTIYQYSAGLELMSQWKAHDKSVMDLAVNDNELISVGRDAKIKFWDKKDGFKLIHEIPAHNYAINAISFSPNKKYFATCSIDKTIKVWLTDQKKLIKVIDKGRHAGHGTSVNRVVWQSDTCLVSSSDDRTLSVWEINVDK